MPYVGLAGLASLAGCIKLSAISCQLNKRYAPCALRYAAINPHSEIRNLLWLSSQELFGHFAIFCDLARDFRKYIFI
jgi:hypothetical protein